MDKTHELYAYCPSVPFYDTIPYVLMQYCHDEIATG